MNEEQVFEALEKLKHELGDFAEKFEIRAFKDISDDNNSENEWCVQAIIHLYLGIDENKEEQKTLYYKYNLIKDQWELWIKTPEMLEAILLTTNSTYCLNLVKDLIFNHFNNSYTVLVWKHGSHIMNIDGISYKSKCIIISERLKSDGKSWLELTDPQFIKIANRDIAYFDYAPNKYNYISSQIERLHITSKYMKYYNNKN